MHAKREPVTYESSKRTTTIAHAMSSSEVDESCKVLQGNCGPSGRWTIALFLSLVVGNFVFSGFLLWKLSVQEKRFEKTVEKLQLDLQELQVEKEEMKQVCTGTIWSLSIISLLLGSRNRLTRTYLVSATCRDYLVARTFGFAFIAPRIGTLQLLQLYETDANDVTMAMIIFARLPDVSMSRKRVRPASSSFVFGFI